MFKYKKISLYILTFLYIIFSFIEFIIYLKVENTIFGLYYLISTMVLIFLLVPCVYNYNSKHNNIRISKLIIVILLGIFNSFILSSIILNGYNYTDGSEKYINSIFIFKNILKPIIYFGLLIITIFETKLVNLTRKNNQKG